MKVSVQHGELGSGGRKASDWIALLMPKAEGSHPRLRGAVSALDKRVGGAIRDTLARGDFRAGSGEPLPI